MSANPQSIPQGDGDSRPLVVHDLGTMPVRPLGFHLELCGPALQPIDRQVRTKQLEMATAIGEVYNAIDRRCLIDLLKAWSRLLPVAGVTPIIQPEYAYRPEHWFWKEAQEAISIALCYCEFSEQARVKWHAADCILRGEASRQARRAEGHLPTYQSAPDIYGTLLENIAVYQAFSEGRAL